MMKLIITLFALATLSTFNGTALGGSNIYRWIDKNGNYHFGASPPTNTDTETIKPIYTQPSSSEPKHNKQNVDQSENNSGRAESEYAKQLRKLEEQREEYCKKAKINKESLLNKHRVMRMDSRGEARMLSHEEKLEQLKKTDQQISEYCGKQ